MTTPGKAVRRFCIACAGGKDKTEDCGGDRCVNGASDQSGVCLFWKYRQGKGRPSVKTIRKMCLWCMGNSSNMVKDCTEVKCPLYLFRFGKNPNFAGRGNPDVLRKWRASQGL